MSDENNIWKGRRRRNGKLSQTNLILIPVPVDNQDKCKKRLMPIECRYRSYQCICDDVKFGESRNAVPSKGLFEGGGKKLKKMLFFL